MAWDNLCESVRRCCLAWCSSSPAAVAPRRRRPALGETTAAPTRELRAVPLPRRGGPLRARAAVRPTPGRISRSFTRLAPLLGVRRGSLPSPIQGSLGRPGPRSAHARFLAEATRLPAPQACRARTWPTVLETCASESACLTTGRTEPDYPHRGLLEPTKVEMECASLRAPKGGAP